MEAYEAKRKEIMEEYAEKMKAAADELELPEHPCKHDVDNHTMEDHGYPPVEGQDFGFPPFFYPPITHFPVIPQSVEEGDDTQKGKTISLPVFYNSYFPRWR